MPKFLDHIYVVVSKTVRAAALKIEHSNREKDTNSIPISVAIQILLPTKLNTYI